MVGGAMAKPQQKLMNLIKSMKGGAKAKPQPKHTNVIKKLDGWSQGQGTGAGHEYH